MNTRGLKLGLAILALVTAVVGLSLEVSAAERPNVVLIFMDNYGWGEPGAYGDGILRGAPSPNIDQLANEIMRLLNFLARRYLKHPVGLEDYFWLSRISTVGTRL